MMVKAGLSGVSESREGRRQEWLRAVGPEAAGLDTHSVNSNSMI